MKPRLEKRQKEKFPWRELLPLIGAFAFLMVLLLALYWGMDVRLPGY